MRVLTTPLLALFIALGGCAQMGPRPPQQPSAPEAAVARLHTLFESEWQRSLEEDPVNASYLGYHDYDDRWPDVSLDALRTSHQADVVALEKLHTIARSALPPEEQLNYDLFERQYRTRVDGWQYKGYLMPLNQRGGIQTADEITEALRFSKVADYRHWIQRLQTFATYEKQTVALMREGIRQGMVQPKVVMQRVPHQIAAQVVDAPDKSPFFRPFKHFPDSIDATTRAQLTARAKEAISSVVIPAYRDFQDFFNNTYLPASRQTIGASDLPNGRDYYRYLTRKFTTTDLTPEQIHQIGLDEVDRIHGEMEKIIKKIGYRGSFSDFLNYLRDDPRNYYKNPEALLEAYRAIAKRIDPELVKLFGKLPRTPYGVRPIPANVAPDTTTAYYSPPAADGSRAGYYYVNLYKPETRPKYEMETLTCHEAVPGHHLQIALAMELHGLPNFRRFGEFTAFTEGWALYAESLGSQLGLYKDPKSQFGRLTYDMWRAVRLVVDTGIHSMGWTRQQAIDYFKANTAKTDQDIVNEVDRYIAWPGQALAYKIGELKIRELRDRARAKLGDAFDIREFHDQVLSHGSIPLDILEKQVDAWIARKLAARQANPS
ncbi:MAG: DUF885 domain-containing protein [Gammaproteobacteria bacterium]|jgi:uncharacterized protein (DUF885 family)